MDNTHIDLSSPQCADVKLKKCRVSYCHQPIQRIRTGARLRLQENVTDLLCPDSGRLQLREDLKNGVYVDNLSEQVVTSGEAPVEVTSGKI